MEKSSFDSITAQKRKHFLEWYFCWTKSNWSKSVMKWPWGCNVQVNELAGEIFSSQSNNQSRNWVSGVWARNLSRVCAKTLLHILKRFLSDFTFSSWIQNRKMEKLFMKKNWPTFAQCRQRRSVDPSATCWPSINRHSYLEMWKHFSAV